MCGCSLVTWEEDVREVNIVYLAVVSTRRGVNHAYFATVCCHASYIYIFFYFVLIILRLVLASTVSAPIAWIPTPVQLVYFLIIGCSFIKGCAVGHRLLLLEYVHVMFSANFYLKAANIGIQLGAT